jgi:hypothetical protein
MRLTPDGTERSIVTVTDDCADPVGIDAAAVDVGATGVVVGCRVGGTGAGAVDFGVTGVVVGCPLGGAGGRAWKLGCVIKKGIWAATTPPFTIASSTWRPGADEGTSN